MIRGSCFRLVGGGGGVRRMAPRTADSSSPEATGPSEANHTSSIDSSRARIARATSAATRGAFSVVAGESASAPLSSLGACSALTGSASAAWSRSPASTSVMQRASRSGFGPDTSLQSSSAWAMPESARESSVSSACSAESASSAAKAQPASSSADETAVRSASACSQQW